MRFLVIFLIPLFLCALQNPYKSLKFDEKFNLLMNHFLNEELKTLLPKRPVLEDIEPLGQIEKQDYERYYTYVQRVKFLKEQNQQERDLAFEVYEGEVGYYNGKLSNLKKDYLQKGQINGVIQNSINKTLKVFYGNPKIKDLTLKDDKIKATLYNKSFYGYNYNLQKDVLLDIPSNIQEKFWNRYKSAKIKVVFERVEDTIFMKDIEVFFDSKRYKGSFLEKPDFKIKLNVKINDDIFRPIIIGDKSEKNIK